MVISPLSFMVAKVYLLVKSTSSVQPFKVMTDPQILGSPFLDFFHLTIGDYIKVFLRSFASEVSRINRGYD